jgi:hypothetical protein
LVHGIGYIHAYNELPFRRTGYCAFKSGLPMVPIYNLAVDS